MTAPRRIISATPAYEQIAQDLRGRVASGQWPAGALLPSRKGLAAEYGVSVPTLERAVADLLADGTLRADGTRGTFVGTRPHEASPTPLPTPAIASPGAASRATAPPRLDAHVTVGVVTALLPLEGATGVMDQWNRVITNSVERTITQAGATARFFNLRRPDGSQATVTTAVEILLAEGVEAIILVLAATLSEIPQAVRAAADRQTPLVFIVDKRFSEPAFSVYYDSRDAGHQAAQHLLNRGCPDLLFFAPYTADWVQERLDGVRQAVRAAGLSAQALRVSVSEEPIEQVMTEALGHQDAGYTAARTLLANGLPAQGVVAANDFVALGFLRAAGDAGLAAGHDFALVGFDDAPQAREASLTSLHPPLEGLGQEAARLALRALQGDTAPVQVCLHSSLVSRSSSRLPLSLVRPETPSSARPASLISTHERGIHHDTAILSSVL